MMLKRILRPWRALAALAAVAVVVVVLVVAPMAWFARLAGGGNTAATQPRTCADAVAAFAGAVVDRGGSDQQWSGRVAAAVAPQVRSGVTAVPRADMPPSIQAQSAPVVDAGVCGVDVAFTDGSRWRVESEQQRNGVWLVTGWAPGEAER